MTQGEIHIVIPVEEQQAGDNSTHIPTKIFTKLGIERDFVDLIKTTTTTTT